MMGGFFTRFLGSGPEHEKCPETECPELPTEDTPKTRQKAVDDEEMEFKDTQTEDTSDKEQKAYEKLKRFLGRGPEHDNCPETECQELPTWDTPTKVQKAVVDVELSKIKSARNIVQESKREWWNVMENYLTIHQIEKQELMRWKFEDLEEEIRINQYDELRSWNRLHTNMEEEIRINQYDELRSWNVWQMNMEDDRQKKVEWCKDILKETGKNIFSEGPRRKVQEQWGEKLKQRWTGEDMEKMKEIEFHEMQEKKCRREWLIKLVEFLESRPVLTDSEMIRKLRPLERKIEDHQRMERSCRRKWREETIKEIKRKVKECGQWYTVSDPSKLLPRYDYHLSLLNWFKERIPYISWRLMFKDCCIIIGGEIKDKQKNELFIPSEERELSYKILLNASLEKRDMLIVYFLNNDPKSAVKKITKLSRQVSLVNATILYAVNNRQINDDQLKTEMIKAARESARVDFVEESRSEIINKMTCILEKRIFDYLQNVKKELSMTSYHLNVKASLLEVNAVLKRLKQAECYPSVVPEDAKQFEMESGSKAVDKILQSFGDEILYHGYNEDRLYIIVTNQSLKENLENLLHECIGNHFEIHIQDKLAITELTKTGVPLHGAKFVYVNETVAAFHADPSFATTGSLMKTNRDQMVVITARHALEKNESDSIYVLIDKEVVRLGGQVEQPENKMECIEEDIAMVQIVEETRPLVEEKCETLLIDNLGLATPARLSECNLEKGDIVHKRGANTGLTTGIVTDVKVQAVGRFRKPSRVINIKGRKNCPFAGPGDSGSLVFKKSLNPEENVLEVHAMVQGKVGVPIPNAEIVCFPFSEGCSTLYRNINHVEPLEFINC